MPAAVREGVWIFFLGGGDNGMFLYINMSCIRNLDVRRRDLAWLSPHYNTIYTCGE